MLDRAGFSVCVSALAVLLLTRPVIGQYGGDFSPPPDPRKQKAPSKPSKVDETPTSPTQVKPRKETGRELFQQPSGVDPADSATGATGWSIMLETFKGKDAAQQAGVRQQDIAGLLRRSDVSVRTTDSGAAVVVGSYRSPADPSAKHDLKMIRELDIGGGVRPYTNAFLVAPGGYDPGQSRELDLASARRRAGGGKFYTVQIAVYETPDKPEEAKRAAEKAAQVLREQGEKAFYYHGPRRSMVTIGLFPARDVDEKSGRARNPEIARIKQAFPLNLLNGQYPILISRDRQQPSELVKVP